MGQELFRRVTNSGSASLFAKMPQSAGENTVGFMLKNVEVIGESALHVTYQAENAVNG